MLNIIPAAKVTETVKPTLLLKIIMQLKVQIQLQRPRAHKKWEESVIVGKQKFICDLVKEEDRVFLSHIKLPRGKKVKYPAWTHGG